jgi:two-component system sensor histidine kinase UhpB
VEADPSRAILDGWDDLSRLALFGGAALLLLHLGLFWLVGRALRPWPTLVAGLARLRDGDYHARLPELSGQEAGLIGREVNRLAAAIEAQLDARMRAFEAERRLEESRELARRLEAHSAAERRAIARTLHDEFAQGITGIRSLARGLQNRLEGQDAGSARTAALISDEAARLYDAMHGLIPRLAPPALDELGLVDALHGLVDRSRASHPGVALGWRAPTETAASTWGLARLGAEPTRTLYAVAQEGLTNALRHAGARQIELVLEVGPADGPQGVRLRVADDGSGLPPDWAQRHRHGLRGLRERVEALGGTLLIGSGIGGRGTSLQATLACEPLDDPADDRANPPSREPS